MRAATRCVTSSYLPAWCAKLLHEPPDRNHLGNSGRQDLVPACWIFLGRVFGTAICKAT